jgi:hypothetical protein
MTMIPNERRSSAAAPTFSIISIIAAVCAILAYRMGITLQIVLAVLAIIFGAIGALIALSPSKRGGMVSIFAIVAGLIGIVVAVFRIIGHVL